MSSNYNMNISRYAYKPVLQWHPQLPIQGKDLETSSHIEYPPFNKRRICENFVPNHWTPGAMREVASGSVKAKQCGSQCQGFGDDSKRLCRMFFNGRNCSYGDRCRFLHVIPDQIRDISMTSVVSSATALLNQNRGTGELGCKGFVGSLSAGGEGNFKPALWKTKICNNWKMSGSCQYGKACSFAHGPAELQNLGGHFALESWTVPTCALKNVHIDRKGTGSYFKQQVQETKGSLKRKQIVKLCDIYADWLEDMIILHSPHTSEECGLLSKRLLEAAMMVFVSILYINATDTIITIQFTALRALIICKGIKIVMQSLVQANAALRRSRFPHKGQKSDVSGEVIKILREDGDPVGYGDALIALLPSFPGIKKLQ
ncbi:hypothetical protein CRYUN_Cryun37aG0034500 [Craigia yunnanensis]